ncbi:MAG: PKD domain-containing protein, partial [Candidatus Dadabacteria bacterium]
MQIPNDDCNSAQVVTPDGSCTNGTTVGANDSWTGSVGCQSGGSHPDAWYSFTATGSRAQFNITTSSPWSGNVEVVLVQGSCSGGFGLVGTNCGSSPLNATFDGLVSGSTYYFTISNSNTGNSGPFSVCLTTISIPPAPGQDCSTAAILCNATTFSQPTSNAGYGNQEVDPTNSCWLNGGERQSKWFKFTSGSTGTLEFNILQVNPNDDYDWALWDITSDPNNCSSKGNSITCNWSGCRSSTGLSSCPASEPGSTKAGAGCGGSYASWSPPVTITAGHTYVLLVDNYSATNSGFSLTFGGACNGGTAKIGPDAAFAYSAQSCGSYNFTKVNSTTNSTFLWQFGDGSTATTENTSHTYSTAGTYIVSLQVTDALGCKVTYSQTITVTSGTTPTFTPIGPLCQGSTAPALPTSSTNGIT